MMKSQGYVRNAPLRYGEGKPPAWWDQELVTWDANLKPKTGKKCTRDESNISTDKELL